MFGGPKLKVAAYPMRGLVLRFNNSCSHSNGGTCGGAGEQECRRYPRFAVGVLGMGHVFGLDQFVEFFGGEEA